MMVRDSQRGKVYKAEEVLRSAHNTRVADPKLDMKGVEEYVRMVWTSPWTQRNFERARQYKAPRVDDGRGSPRARGNIWALSLPRWSRTKWVMLHEIAHALTAKRPAHGWEWAKNYHALVQHFLGVEAGTRLALSFRLNRVRFRAPRRLSPEQRARLIEVGRKHLIPRNASVILENTDIPQDSHGGEK